MRSQRKGCFLRPSAGPIRDTLFIAHWRSEDLRVRFRRRPCSTEAPTSKSGRRCEHDPRCSSRLTRISSISSRRHACPLGTWRPWKRWDPRPGSEICRPGKRPKCSPAIGCSRWHRLAIHRIHLLRHSLPRGLSSNARRITAANRTRRFGPRSARAAPPATGPEQASAFSRGGSYRPPARRCDPRCRRHWTQLPLFLTNDRHIRNRSTDLEAHWQLSGRRPSEFLAEAVRAGAPWP